MIHLVNNIEDANCITHSGTMHADEVFATAFLNLYLEDIKVYRTSNVDLNRVKDNTIIYDIGRGEFDHHQMDAKKRDNGITYCAFGLLWQRFGKDYLRKIGIELVDKVFDAVDKDLVEGIDADDNGVFPKIEASYKPKTLPNIIKLFNPSYNSNETEQVQFEKACSVAQKILEEEILYINGKVIAEEKINKLIDNLNENDKYIVLDTFLPYEETILNNSKANNILYVAYPSSRGGYAIKVVPKSIDDKTARKLFPEEWAGLENEELERVSGIKDILFCHIGRFIVSCNTLESVYNILNKVSIDC